MQTFMVGGAVRDRLLGFDPKDIDFVVVGSTPEEMLAAGFKQVGADFPVFLSPDGAEYALARTERKSGRGYNGFTTDASPTVTLEQDLERRDLTINAMAMSERPDELELHDPFGGRRDLDQKVLRHVSPAFADDPVRVLRLARFHARYGDQWSVAPETLVFARQMVEAGELAFLTRERVLAELEKALQEQSPHLFFETLHACGAMDVVFPEMAGMNHKLLSWTLMNFPSRSGRFNWAKMSALMVDPENFERRLNVTNHWRSFAKLFRAAASLANLHPVERLYAMDVYRQSGVWEALLYEAKEAGFSLDFLAEAYNVTKHVSFDTLPEQARETLKGKAIADAIMKQRKFAYDSSMNAKL